ncbi:MAG: phosphoribosylanthranilate isomerase [Lachnospiraceae bacterium]|nr:phosphoribosylanthranilate isomerase [Lachnospiraceae bacterium]
MSKVPRIKICGLTRPEETEYLNECKVDYAGFVFYEKSKRNVTFKQAGIISGKLDKSIKKVAVAVSPDITMVEKINEAGFDIIQIHGELDMDVLKVIKIPIWRAVNIVDLSEADKLLDPVLKADGDADHKIRGILMDAPDFGSGKTFNWHKSRRLLKAGDRSSPFYGRDLIFAGGLNDENVKEGIELFDPDIVDVSSSVEGENGKSRDKIQKFVNAVRS